jgi:hypothetical protein
MAILEREVGAAVLATAAVLSPRVRNAARQSVVYGLAGAMKAGDVLLATARGAAHGVQEGMTGHHDGPAGDGAPQPAPTAEQPPPPARPAGRSQVT